MYFYNARYYDPALGRFIQADTIVPSPANPQTLNRYAYTRNNPIKYNDPSGHDVGCGGIDCGDTVLENELRLKNYERMLNYYRKRYPILDRGPFIRPMSGRSSVGAPATSAATFAAPVSPASVSGYRFGDPVDYNTGLTGDWSNKHVGTDYGPPGGDNHVMASTSGTVVSAGFQKSYGFNVIVEYPNATLPMRVQSLQGYDEGNSAYVIYAHLADPDNGGRLLPTVGVSVSGGDAIGIVGATGMVYGAHLHTEVRLGPPGLTVSASNSPNWYNPLILTPVDPELVFGGQ